MGPEDSDPGVSVTERSDSGGPRRLMWAAIVICIATALVGGVLFALYVRGGGPVPDAFAFLRPRAADPLAASSPAETVLRTLRLAGFDRASVGVREGTVVVRVAMPATDSGRQVELTWQTALTAGALAYPARRPWSRRSSRPTGRLCSR